MIYVQFFDASKTAIVSVFGNAQDPIEFPNQDQIEPSDSRWKAYFDALPASMQEGLTPPA